MFGPVIQTPISAGNVAPQYEQFTLESGVSLSGRMGGRLPGLGGFSPFGGTILNHRSTLGDTSG
jgi:hypothetical protein